MHLCIYQSMYLQGFLDSLCFHLQLQRLSSPTSCKASRFVKLPQLHIYIYTWWYLDNDITYTIWFIHIYTVYKYIDYIWISGWIKSCIMGFYPLKNKAIMGIHLIHLDDSPEKGLATFPSCLWCRSEVVMAFNLSICIYIYLYWNLLRYRYIQYKNKYRNTCA